MSVQKPGVGGSGARVARVVVQRLESLARAGVSHIPKPTAPATPISLGGGIRTIERNIDPPKVQPVCPAPSIPESLSAVGTTVADDRVSALARIECKVAVCTRCPELARTRKKTVFGAGNPHARLVFMGEAPGADEDLQGEPFVGKAGQKLTEIIEKGMRLRREDVYILNTIKCRPPANRVPTAEEAANCREYLDAQLAILQPEFICCLGATAAQNLLGLTLPIGQLRGRFYEYRGIKVLCTYHPSYVLRSPEVARPAVWSDIQMLMRAMGLSIPKK